MAKILRICALRLSVEPATFSGMTSCIFHPPFFEPLEPRLFLTVLYRIDVIPSPQLATDYRTWIQISDLNDAGEVMGTVEGGRSEVEVQEPFIWTTKDSMRVLSLPDGKRGVAQVLSPSGS